MVTQRQRIAVTLSDETRELVQRLADLENTSMSKVVANVMDSFAPTIRQLVEAAEAFQQLPEKRREEIRALIEEAEPGLLEKTDAAQSAFSDALGLVGK